MWYEGAPSYRLLLPLSGIYWFLITLRRFLYQIGLFGRHKAAVPVIVVGNITTGGTGKTPVTIWLVNALRERPCRWHCESWLRR
jgi:tetraacyldisaccharide 4'-kinase